MKTYFDGKSLFHIASPKSLQSQLVARALFILFGLLVLVGGFQYLFMNNFLFENRASTIRTEIHAIPPDVWTNAMQPEGTSDSDDRLPLYSLGMPAGSTIAIVEPPNHLTTLVDSSNKVGPPALAQSVYNHALSHGFEAGYQVVHSTHEGATLVVLTKVHSSKGSEVLVQVGYPTDRLTDILMRQLAIFAILAAAALIAGLLLLVPAIRQTLIPLSRMIRTVKQINAGNLSERFSITQSHAEIELLASSFNDMLERLDESFEAEREAKERLRQFVADASHELRTPLTSLNGFIEVLRRGAAHRPDQLDTALTSMYSETQRLTKLVQDLLTLARLDQVPKTVSAPTNISETIGDMAPQLHVLAGQRDVLMSLEPNLTLWCDIDGIKQVVLNLVQNAIQYTDDETGRIDITLKRYERYVELSICDNGAGIPEEAILHLFDRFYRVDMSRARRYGGSGLGLAIVQSIVEAHGGSITCKSEVGNGTTFVIQLPLEQHSTDTEV